MSFLKAKQITKFLEARRSVTGLTTTSGVSNIITAALGVVAASDGVPVQVANKSNGTVGFIVSGNNKIDIWSSSTKDALQDQKGNEVYGKITKPGADYLIEFYSRISGVETAYSMPASKVLDFTVNYYFDFARLPDDVLTRVNSLVVGQDPDIGAFEYTELLTVSSLNTVSDVTKNPTSNIETAYLIINGQVEDNLASGAFSLSGKVITWNAANAGYNLEVGDRVVARYKTFE